MKLVKIGKRAAVALPDPPLGVRSRGDRIEVFLATIEASDYEDDDDDCDASGTITVPGTHEEARRAVAALGCAFVLLVDEPDLKEWLNKSYINRIVHSDDVGTVVRAESGEWRVETITRLTVDEVLRLVESGTKRSGGRSRAEDPFTIPGE